MGEITRLTKATSKSDSLRTTVPSGVVSHFKLKEKDELEWNIEVKNGELVLIVKPIN